MSAFHFLRPGWLAALPLLLALLWLLWRRRLRSRSWQAVCDPALLPHLLLAGSRRRANWPLALLLTGLLLTVVALAGPTWRQRPQPLLRQASALVVCFDLSRSMAAADLKPSRLVRARLKVEDLLRQRREGQTALVAFAGDAFAVTPLTEDRRTIEALLATLEPDLMPVQGSAPARALVLGAEMIRQAGLQQGTLLLVTDEDRPESAIETVARLHRQGHTVAVLGVGTVAGAPIPMKTGGFFKDAGGDLVLARLEEPGLTRLAEAGGGRYRRLRVDDRDFQDLLAHLDHRGLDGTRQPARRMGDRWEEAGVWLLWPLCLLAAAAFRRGWLAVVVLALTLPAGARAAGWNDLWRRADRQAYEAYTAKDYDRAADGFEDPRWKAGALYRAGKYAEALDTVPPPHSGDDWYNQGNFLARAGRFTEALAAYDQALSIDPEDADARENRRLVKEALERQRRPPPRAKDPSDGSDPSADGDTAGSPSQDRDDANGKPAPSQGAGASPDAGRGDRPAHEPPPQEGTDGTPSREPENRKEDAVSGAEGQAPDRPETSPDRPPEAAAGSMPDTTADADQRQMQQWLQRIPDDPGGLMRRKFLYQYRQRGRQMETDRPW